MLGRFGSPRPLDRLQPVFARVLVAEIDSYSTLLMAYSAAGVPYMCSWLVEIKVDSLTGATRPHGANLGNLLRADIASRSEVASRLPSFKSLAPAPAPLRMSLPSLAHTKYRSRIPRILCAVYAHGLRARGERAVDARSLGCPNSFARSLNLCMAA